MKNVALLTVIFLASFLVSGCTGQDLKDLRIISLDTRRGVAFPYKIADYSTDTCSLKLEDLPLIPLNSSQLNGAVCLTKEDYLILQSKFKRYCFDRRN